MDLRSSRTSIRPWKRQDDDYADTWPPYNDPLDPLWNIPRPISFSRESWVHNFDGGSMWQAWAVENHGGCLIGRISLREIDQRRNQARLGITFGAPFVGAGLGTEALQLFLGYYFSALGFLTMVLDVAGPNQRAVRCYQRLGFRPVGDDWRDAPLHFNARVLDESQYAPLRSFFRSGRRGLEVQFFEMQLLKEDWVATQDSAF